MGPRITLARASISTTLIAAMEGVNKHQQNKIKIYTAIIS
jgi:hypothetical protein